jgi:hypothetical protein
LTLTAIRVLALVLAIVWRLGRLGVKLLLLGALIALIVSGTSATPRRAPPARAQSVPARRQPPAALGAIVSAGPSRRSRAPVKRPTAGRN